MSRIAIMLAACLITLDAQLFAQPFAASGIKIGEVDQTSAIIWARLTKESSLDLERLPAGLDGPMPADIVPGQAGQMAIRYWVKGDTDSARQTEWVSVDQASDFATQFSINELTPNTAYQFEVRADQDNTIASGSFATAPSADHSSPIRFVVTTCQAVLSVDSGVDGHAAYAKMLDFDPDFFVHTGDIVYYDKLPLAKTVDQARAKWHLMFGYGFNKRFHEQVPSYFMKDDHDTLKNDCWPGQKYGEISFDQGLAIFRQQVPMGDQTYRTFRWGSDVQIWMTENRDFRSPNNMEDGPQKTILGEQQKKWLMDTVAASDATWKFVISPGPIVGPDKKGKNDNHSNDAFANEGQQLRDFLAAQQRTFVICGDRHWQYCSQDPETGLLELGCGPINDQHNFGGNPGQSDNFHRYFSNKGGFLGITVQDGNATATWYGVNDTTGKILPEATELHSESLK